MSGLDHPEFQPRWVAFAHAHGCRPEDLIPGVLTNIAFLDWVRGQWAEFGFAPDDSRTDADHAAFDAWLADRFAAAPPASSVEMVRPHDLRPGDVIRVGRELRTVSSRTMPQVSERRHRLVVTTDAGLVSWTVAEATFPQVERVARADRQAVA